MFFAPFLDLDIAPQGRIEQTANAIDVAGNEHLVPVQEYRRIEVDRPVGPEYAKDLVERRRVIRYEAGVGQRLFPVLKCLDANDNVERVVSKWYSRNVTEAAMPSAAFLDLGSVGSIPVQVPPASVTNCRAIECLPKPISSRFLSYRECRLASCAAVTHLRIGLPNEIEHLDWSLDSFGQWRHEMARAPLCMCQYGFFHTLAHPALLSRSE